MIARYLPYYKRNLKLALPIVLAQLGQVVVQQADIMMVGHLGATELAAIAFSNAIFIFGLVFTMGFSLGLTPAVGHISDKTDYKILAKLLTNAYFINSVISLITMGLLYFSSFFFEQMGQDMEVVALAKPYFYATVISLLPLSFFITNKQFAEGLGDTKNAMYITLFSNVLNIVLNYLLIFGKLGFPELGMLGAGVATLISRVLMAIGFLAIFKRRERFRPISSFISFSYFDLRKIRELFRLGFPISVQMLLEVAAFAFSGIMAGWLGVVPQASHQIVLGIVTITFMLAVGVGSATTIRVAHYFAQKDWRNLIMAATASSHIIITFMGCSGLCFFLFRNTLPAFYTTDADVISLSGTLLVTAALFQLFDGLQVVMLSILRGLGDVTHAMWCAFIAYLLVNLPISYLLSFTFGLGTIGLWFGFIVGLGVAGVLFYARIRVLYRSFE